MIVIISSSSFLDLLQYDEVRRDLERSQCSEAEASRKQERIVSEHQKLSEYSRHQAKQLEQQVAAVSDLQSRLKQAQHEADRLHASRSSHFPNSGDVYHYATLIV